MCPSRLQEIQRWEPFWRVKSGPFNSYRDFHPRARIDRAIDIGAWQLHQALIIHPLRDARESIAREKVPHALESARSVVRDPHSRAQTGASFDIRDLARHSRLRLNAKCKKRRVSCWKTGKMRNPRARRIAIQHDRGATRMLETHLKHAQRRITRLLSDAVSASSPLDIVSRSRVSRSAHAHRKKNQKRAIFS